jgi:hypothetical protein
MNLHILCICASFKENNYIFYDGNQIIIYKFSKESLRKLVEILVPLKKASENIKKVPKTEKKMEMEEKIENTNQSEVNKE